ncbi:YggS family pyridoxal phosphate-dependent enzyme [Desulfosarcina sp. OttesenSCG-928-A07]|nr:YggS family pyridoxal phosphate-dependent enzyme [Desulfosarcina sp. OttesenSCG-928-G17]MDL2329621.1 YggS family pyridoxal phosphate-dependent enzyme [Desulfosarcina sp. OttesenSCG-928-A07]
MKQVMDEIRQRIHHAAVASGRPPEAVRLVAVTKTVGADRVADAVSQGVDMVGESYIQEAREKFDALQGLPVSWHFIGHLQSNKAKYAVRMFDLIHSVDSFKLARELSREAEKYSKIQDILIQVNISQEETKSGIKENAVLDLISDISALSHVRVMGLMTIPPFFDEPEKSRPVFRHLAKLKDQIMEKGISGVHLTELSMGMTGDFEVAVSEGATLVRIGTALFGTRQ